MAEDVVFLTPGNPPMRGHDAFAASFQAVRGMRIEGHPEIQEIQIFGDRASCWNHLSVDITPLSGGEPVRRSGHILSIFRKESDGRWVLWRDANLLTAEK